MNKSFLRHKIQCLRDNLDADVRDVAQLHILEHMLALVQHVHQPSFIMALYHPIKSEVNILGVRALLPSYHYALPRTHGGIMQMHEWNHTLVEGAFGVMQPPSESVQVIPHVCIVPLLGFDRRGARLGYGKGYYDQYLARHPQIIPIGVAFSCQEVHNIPVEAHDQRLHHIITEKEVITP
ncbi:MAG: 5-formyltetrahydrofolate cyclo-ligase [Alphaproteobacteria bacterium]|nr:MAG: 5-formyltetrahydrofolate cyclo-ligase [Alphaproteobacteria bacterium]